MGNIDERIVKLSFDNKGFESGVAKTLASLEKLNQALEKTDNRQAAKELTKSMNDINKILKNNNLGNLDKLLNKQSGFSKITDGISKMGSGLINAFKKIDFTGIGSKLSSMFKGSTDGASALAKGVESVTAKFSNLQVVAATALANITNRMVNAGIAMGKALTIDPIKDGFSEYETKMNAMQTIFANTSHKGTTYDDIKKALDELNTYSDKTIYNFGQMTDNIGKFTAAGVDLDTSVTAIKGLANLAAMSGVDNARAQGVMYQASQALSKGYFQLMDWRSFSNNGMGNDRFKQLLIETGDLLGTGASAAIEAAGSFDESLSKSKWLTNDVMNEALKMLAGYYTEADLLQMGFNKKQAQNVMQLAKQAEDSATQIRTVTQLFDTMKEAVGSGWAQTWEWIIGDKEQATKTLTGISKAFENMIKPGIEARNKMFEEWNKGGGRDSLISGFKNMFEGVGKVAGSVKDAFRDIFPAMTGKKLIELTKGFENFTEKLKISDKTAAKIKDTFKGVFSIFGIVRDAFKSVLSVFGSGVGIFTKLGGAALTVTASIGKFFTNMYESLHASRIFENAANAVKSGLNSVQRFFTSCGETIGIFIGSLSKLDFKPLLDAMGEIGKGVGKGLSDIFEGLGKAIGTIDFNKILAGLTVLAGKDIFKTIKDSILGFKDSLTSFSKIGDSVKGVLNGVRDALKAYQDQLSAGTLLRIAGAIGILAGAILLLASIKPAQMENALVAMATMLIELVAALATLIKIVSASKIKGLFIVSSALLSLSAALLVMSAAVRSMSSLSWDEIARGLVGVAGSMLILVAASHLLNAGTKGMLGTAAAMVVLGAALIVMAEAVKRFGQLDCGTMIQGLLGVAATLAELGLFMKLTAASKLGLANSAGILMMAASMLVFQKAVEKFGSMDIPSLVKGLASVGALLLELAAFTKLASGATGMLTTSAAMVVMAAAINLMVPAVKSLGNLSWEEIAKGLTSLAGSLVVLGVAAAAISGAKLAAVGAGLAVMSASMLLLSAALKSMGSMSWEQIAKSLVTLAGALVIFAAAMAAMSGGLAGAAAMLVMAGAMAIFTPQLIAMANLSWGQIAAGLVMLAGSFAVIGVAGLVLGPLVPVIAGLAASITLLGVGCAAAGAGVALFATGMATLATVGAAGGFALAEILRQLIGLIPQFAASLGKAIVEFAKVIGESMPTLATAMGQCMIGILQAISSAIPQIVQTGIQLISGLCQAIEQSLPRLIELAVKMVIALANGLASNAGKLVDAAVNLVVSLINALAGKIGDIIQAGIDFSLALVNGLADGIRNNQDRVKDAITNLATAILETFMNLLGISGSDSSKFKEFGIGTITSLATGIGSKVGEVVDKIKQLATDMITNIKNKVGEFLTTGAQLITQLGSGVASKVGDVVGKIKKLATDMITNIKTKAGEFLSSGAQLIGQLASGIASRASNVVSNIKTCVSNAVSAARSQASAFLSAGTTIITNLVSGVKSKASQISSTIKSAISSAKSAASGMASSFRSIGSNIIQGLVGGIKSMASSVASAARSIVQGAINAAKSALKIHSPSRVFMEIGKYTGEGMVIGLDNTAGKVARSAEDMANGAISIVKRSVSRIGEALTADMDTQPTIRPVLDLSNVEAGAQTLNGMLNNSQLSANLSGNISSSIGNIQNGSSNAEIIAAIRGLKDSMNNNSGNVYQINGITYDDGSNVSNAVETLIRAARIERRI